MKQAYEKQERTPWVGIVVLSLAIGAVVGALLYWTMFTAAPAVQPTIRVGPSESRLWEDGSYNLSLGKFSIVGCAPVHPWNSELVAGWCMDGGTSALGYFSRGTWVWTIGVDSPWEDFFPAPVDSFMYWIIDLLFK